MKFTIPEEVLYIINTLYQKNFPTYLVGGCIRDLIRGKAPADWDIATAAKPRDIMNIFQKTIPTGLAHGTVTVVLSGGQYEITTFRIDGTYENHRSPESVTFTNDITLDLSRRDFTMNAIAYHPQTGLIDPFGGLEDINARFIRCVGDPRIRFNEDALRMMRAIRFSAQTGFSVSEEILAAIKLLAPSIQSISAERIRDELTKTLLSDEPEKLVLLHETELLPLILPELSRCFATKQNIKYHIFDVGMHIMKVVSHTPNNTVLRLAALLHDIGKPDKKTTDEAGVDHFKGHDLRSVELAENVLTRLRYDNKTKKQVLALILYHDREIAETKKSIRKMVSQIGDELFSPLLLLKRADTLGQNPVLHRERLNHYDTIQRLYNEIKADGDAFTLTDLAIGGRELMALGYQGKEIGTLLERLLNHVLEYPEDNQREILLAQVPEKIK